MSCEAVREGACAGELASSEGGAVRTASGEGGGVGTPRRLTELAAARVWPGCACAAAGGGDKIIRLGFGISVLSLICSLYWIRLFGLKV